MDNKFIFLSVSFVAMSLVTACSSFTNKGPDQNPPRLVSSEKQEQYGWSGSRREYVMWDRPEAFGNVPDNLQSIGDNLCQAGGFSRAAGYHPSALGVNGQPIPGGGYLCSGYRLKRNVN